MAFLETLKFQSIRSIQKIFRDFGIDIRRYHGGANEEASLVFALRHFGISKLIDVGANEGQFGLMMRDYGFQGEIVSFEPLPDVYDVLKERARKYPPWIVAPRMAIGERNGDVQLHVASNLASSSIRMLNDLHLNAAPDVKMVGQIQTPLYTLDTILEQIGFDPTGAFLKIDTQGYEKQVLDGATKTLQKISGIQLELSLDQVYIDQEDHMYFFEFAQQNGFRLWNLTPELFDKSNGRLLQTNGFFFRF